MVENVILLSTFNVFRLIWNYLRAYMNWTVKITFIVRLYHRPIQLDWLKLISEVLSLTM